MWGGQGEERRARVFRRSVLGSLECTLSNTLSCLTRVKEAEERNEARESPPLFVRARSVSRVSSAGRNTRHIHPGTRILPQRGAVGKMQ